MNSDAIVYPDLINDRRQHSRSEYLGLVVIDAQCRVKFSFWDGSQSAEPKSLVLDDEGALRPDVKARVATMIELFDSGDKNDRHIILLGQKHAVRLSPLFGVDEKLFGEDEKLFGEDEKLFGEGEKLFGEAEKLFAGGGNEKLFGLIVEADRDFNSISRAAGRFGLTKRQAQVLALVLEGSSAAEIAQVLSISEYTAQGYLKSLLSKTGSRNRAAMVAKVLNWNRESGSIKGGPLESRASETGTAGPS